MCVSGSLWVSFFTESETPHQEVLFLFCMVPLAVAHRRVWGGVLTSTADHENASSQAMVWRYTATFSSSVCQFLGVKQVSFPRCLGMVTDSLAILLIFAACICVPQTCVSRLLTGQVSGQGRPESSCTQLHHLRFTRSGS